LKIIRQVAEFRPNYLWVLVGRRGDENPLDWNLSNVLISPSVSQKALRDYYVAVDLLVLPSVGEGIPLVVQEAMVCATPVLVSGETQGSLPNAPILSLQSLDPLTLLSKLDFLVSNPSEANALRMSVSLYATNIWDWEDVAVHYENLYRELLSNQISRQ
jgi:glycosyltransferase involved in cell wall biosynthesis